MLADNLEMELLVEVVEVLEELDKMSPSDPTGGNGGSGAPTVFPGPGLYPLLPSFSNGLGNHGKMH